ncbi:hypothetical protein H6G89_32555 [Oscillatoria sp. FACHB-1407]|uniref:hypothetical protein n=1 Tax=Oscillatoria sp. FACHB-1407 TaxID=2692847 RepID=UPI001688E538|nr:hypothetical protein [Oscillatoria sp. FACHB-1407]MBD2465721.1 hypothetical protein [Oscillatoria sp. FACHB-1407]
MKKVLATDVVVADGVVSEGEAIAQLNSKSKGESDAVQNIEQSKTQPESSPEQPNEQPQELRLTADQLQAAITQAIDNATAPLRQQIEQTQQQLNEAIQQRDSLQQVFNVIGKPAVMVNTKLAPGRGLSETPARGRAAGLAADFMQACESAPSEIYVNRKTGKRYVHRDLNDARRVFHSDRLQLRKDMEQLARDHGFLQGYRRMSASDAVTVRTDIAPLLLDYLSMVIRETHSARFIYWQFPWYELELGKGPGDTVQVSRQRWIAEPTTVASRTLTPGVPLTNTRQNISSGAVTIALQERGLGLDASNPPVAIPEFLTAYSMINLENVVISRLGHDYEASEDLFIRTRYFATTRVVYNNRQSVTTNPGSLTASGDGTITENFLNNLYAYMSGLQIPPLDDGCYVYPLHTTGLAQLKNSLSAKNQYLDQMNLEELTMLLQVASNREMGRCSGYAGSACGFHLFNTNAHSMGAAGTEGVQTETLGAGSTLTRASVAFGRAAVARAIGMEAEIRTDNNDDFQRLDSFTWLSHETTGDLDVDPAIHPDQQLRVVEVHTTDVVL